MRPDPDERGNMGRVADVEPTQPERPTLREPLAPLADRRRDAGRDVGARDHRPAARARTSTAGASGRARPAGCSASRLAPFLHSGLSHLIANTIPFVVLGAFIAIGDAKRFVEVTVIVALTSGLGTWLFAAPGTIHIGASGLVFGYLTYLVVRGFFAGKPLWILGGLVVLAFYGGILWGLLPRPGISFTGHLFGAVGGVLAAWYVHGREPDDADLPGTAST